MWLFRVLTFLLALNLPAGCGFEPLYGHRGAVNASNELASIRIKPIKDRIGQQLHNHLLDLMNPHGRPARPIYVLEVSLKSANTNVAVSKEALATRVNFNLSAQFRLLDAQSGKILYSGNDLVVTGYNVLASNFATKTAENDAQARAARQAALNIQAQIASYLKTNPLNASGARQ